MLVSDASLVSRLLPVGQRITIVPDSRVRQGEGEPEGYPSRIEDVLDDAVVVSMPMRRRTLIALPLNSAVSAYFNRSGARYYFRATVGARAETPFPVLYLRDVGSVKKEDRRTDVRVDVVLEPIQMVVVDGDAEKAPDSRSTLVVNVSAGGLGLICRRPVSVGSVIHIALDLPRNLGTIEADAEVVRSSPMELGGLQKWQVGVSFRDVSQKEKDRITAFVLYQQQLLRRRGLM